MCADWIAFFNAMTALRAAGHGCCNLRAADVHIYPNANRKPYDGIALKSATLFQEAGLVEICPTLRTLTILQVEP